MVELGEKVLNLFIRQGVEVVSPRCSKKQKKISRKEFLIFLESIFSFRFELKWEDKTFGIRESHSWYSVQNEDLRMLESERIVIEEENRDSFATENDQIGRAHV